MKQQWEPPELEEMQVVILSLHQKWWQKMAAGEKVLELRKTKPQCKAPFRVLVYVTGGAGVMVNLFARRFWKSRTLKKQRRKARFLHMIFTIMQQGAATRFTAGKSQT